LAMRLAPKDEERHCHDGIVVQGEPAPHLAQLGPCLVAAEQVIDDRSSDREAGDDDEHDQRDDGVGAREPESCEPGPGHKARVGTKRAERGILPIAAGGSALARKDKAGATKNRRSR
jgi:hypothetical protein